MSSSTINHRRGSHGEFPRRRGGFTLTELLIGITIIGLLVGLLAVAGAGVIGTAREFAVNSEIVQLNQATENFNTQFGFYPPSFEQFKRQANRTSGLAFVQDEVNQILPFLNKISANHSELNPSPVPARAALGFRRIDDWWQNVGVYLNQSTSLPFWLSGLSENKQFPFTGGLDGSTFLGGTMTNVEEYLIVGINASRLIDGVTEITSLHSRGVDRQIFFDIEIDRVNPVQDPFGFFPVGQLTMEFGKTNGDLFYLYRDSNSYLPPFQVAGNLSVADWQNALRMDYPTLFPFRANGVVYSNGGPSPTISELAVYLADQRHGGAAYHAKIVNPVNGSITLDFGNANTVQIISAGLDGDPGISDPETGFTEFVNRRDINLQLPKSADNLCNFAGGRLDTYIIEQQQ